MKEDLFEGDCAFTNSFWKLVNKKSHKLHVRRNPGRIVARNHPYFSSGFWGRWEKNAVIYLMIYQC